MSVCPNTIESNEPDQDRMQRDVIPEAAVARGEPDQHEACHGKPRMARQHAGSHEAGLPRSADVPESNVMPQQPQAGDEQCQARTGWRRSRS